MKFKPNGWQLNIAVETPSRREVKSRQVPANDDLFGLTDFHGFSETAQSEIKRSERCGRGFAVLGFDINEMKQLDARYDDNKIANKWFLTRLFFLALQLPVASCWVQ
jgi:hypothetical protein